MAAGRLRVALDANVLIAGIRLPRWPHEVMRAAVRRELDLVLPEQIIEEALRHLNREQQHVLEEFLAAANCETVPMPPADVVHQNTGLVRSEKDLPIALALLMGDIDVFVTNDRDFTDEGATAERFGAEVSVMLPALFLRRVAGWTSEELEAIRSRGWAEMEAE